MPLLLVLSDWTGCVVGNLRSHGFDFILNGIKVPMGDARKTNAYFITLPDFPISIVLGTRKRTESEEGLEAFLEVCSAYSGSMGNVVARITHTINKGVKTWKYAAERDFVGLVDEVETNSIGRSLDWVNAIATTIKAQTATPPS